MQYVDLQIINQLSSTYDLLIVFLFKSLQDPSLNDEDITDKIKINKLLEKLLMQKYLSQCFSQAELMREFLPPILECFLGKQQQFKKYLHEAVEQINLPSFKLEDIIGVKKKAMPVLA